MMNSLFRSYSSTVGHRSSRVTLNLSIIIEKKLYYYYRKETLKIKDFIARIDRIFAELYRLVDL